MRYLGVIVVCEVLVWIGLGWGLVVSLFADGSLLADAAVPVRTALLIVAAVQAFVPVYVYVDLRRRPDLDRLWLHAAVMPAVNVVGFLAYLAERSRQRDAASARNGTD
jgi:hypothetical protein